MDMNESQPARRLFSLSTLVMIALFALSAALFALTSGDRLSHLFKPIFVFLRMASIVGLIGVPMYFVGESIPRSLYNPERFPFKCYSWEKNGRIYEPLGIRWRKRHTLDMSKLMSGAFPKQNTMRRDPAHLRRLILEMCNAEFIHWILAFLSPVFACLIEGWYGVAISIGYALSNLSHVMIQRYNRPRIMMILKRIEKCAGF